MNLFVLVWSYLKAKPLNTILNILLLSMGIGVITTLLLFNNQFQEKMSQNSHGIDLVVGAKGSPLQLVLCSVFHIDYPTGNIKLSEAQKLSKNRLVKRSIPMALGDSYKNFRIIGTDTSYTNLFNAKLKEGNWWSKDLEVVVGSDVAEKLQLKIGEQFVSAHGLTNDGHAHDENKYNVTGILEPSHSVIDNLLFTNIGSIWLVHGLGDQPDSIREITSLLIKYRNPIAALQLPRMINTYTNMQAASPAFESARLFSILGVGVDVLLGVASTIIVVSGLSIFIALYNSLKERRYDMAIMRAIGIGRGRLFSTMIMEGAALTFCGSVLGLLLGHLLVFGFTTMVEEGARTGISAFVFYKEELIVLAGSMMLGVVCSLIPAIQAYKTDIHKVLSGN